MLCWCLACASPKKQSTTTRRRPETLKKKILTVSLVKRIDFCSPRTNSAKRKITDLQFSWPRKFVPGCFKYCHRAVCCSCRRFSDWSDRAADVLRYSKMLFNLVGSQDNFSKQLDPCEQFSDTILVERNPALEIRDALRILRHSRNTSCRPKKRSN